MGTQPKQRKL